MRIGFLGVKGLQARWNSNKEHSDGVGTTMERNEREIEYIRRAGKRRNNKFAAAQQEDSRGEIVEDIFAATNKHFSRGETSQKRIHRCNKKFNTTHSCQT